MALFSWLLLSSRALALTATGDTGATTAGTATTGDTGAGTDTGTASTGTTGTTGDTADPSADLDQDNDGFTPREGDCDDDNREVNPSQEEICADRLDNDCNGLFDDRCDDSAKLGSLRGGGGCTGGQSVVGTQGVIVLLAGFALRGRRGARLARGGELR